MKNQILLLLLVLAFGCTEQATKTETTQAVEAPKTVGFMAGNESVKWALGSDEAIDVWVKWCEYHNTQEIDKIMALAADNIEVSGPEGEYIKGKEALKGLSRGLARCCQSQIQTTMGHRRDRSQRQWDAMDTQCIYGRHDH